MLPKGNSKRGRPKRKVSEELNSSDEFVKRKVLPVLLSFPRNLRRQLLLVKSQLRLKRLRKKGQLQRAKYKFLKARVVTHLIVKK